MFEKDFLKLFKELASRPQEGIFYIVPENISLNSWMIIGGFTDETKTPVHYDLWIDKIKPHLKHVGFTDSEIKENTPDFMSLPRGRVFGPKTHPSGKWTIIYGNDFPKEFNKQEIIEYFSLPFGNTNWEFDPHEKVKSDKYLELKTELQDRDFSKSFV